jgi:DnaK suppressor protein
MTKIELKTFTRKLATRQAELETGSVNRAALTIESSPDELDRIQDAGNRDWAMGNLERGSNQLREVQTAFQRIAAGTFGVCIDCEGAISPKRLAAVPWAASCIYCQQLADRQDRPPVNEFDSSFVIAA